MDGHETEDRIVEAALALWHEGGIGKVTTRAVATRAGVNEVTLFRHFASKEGLLRAMVGKALPERPGGAVAVPTDGPPVFSLEGELKRWADAYLAHVLPVGDVLLLGLVEAQGRPDLRAACFAVPRHLQGELAGHLHSLEAAGLIPDGPFEAVAEMFYARLFVHAIAHHLQPEDRTDEVARQAAAVCSRALSRADADADAPQSVDQDLSGGAFSARGTGRG